MFKAIYARQSVDRADSISVESQIEFCKYELRGESFREYVDKGYSGKDTNRPAFRRLLSDIRHGAVETVIVYKLDRISRSILDFSTMMETFMRYNVEFISSTEKFDTSSPIGRAMLNICIVFAQLERETIQKRVTDAYRSRSKKGFYMGGRIPYGFRKADTVIGGVKTSCYEPVPDEAEQIRLMYSLYSKPEASLADIIRYFDARGVAHLRGKRWSTARLSELMRNPVYVRADADIYDFFKNQGVDIINAPSDFAGINACYLYKGDMDGSKGGELRGKQVVLAPHEGLVPADLWLNCRVKFLNNRQSALHRKPKNSWLAGKTKCQKCGYALTVRRNSQERRYFVCTSGSGCGEGKCPGPGTIHAERLEETIYTEIGKKLAGFRSLSPPEPVAQDPKRIEKKVRLAQLEREARAWADKVPDANKALMKYINEKIISLEAERERLLLPNSSFDRVHLDNPLHAVTDHARRWKDACFEEKKLIADILIRKIFINGGSIEILWNI